MDTTGDDEMSWNEPKEMADYCHTIDEPDMAEEIIKLGERITELEAQLAKSEEAYEVVSKDCQNLTEKVIPNIKAQLAEAYPCYLTWKGYTDNEGEPETCLMQGFEEWQYCPVCKAALQEQKP